MKIAFIGAGNLATHLAQALLAAGHDVAQVYSRTEASAGLLARRLGCEAVTAVADIVADADLYVFSVSDSALEQLAAQVCPGREKGVFVHTAGSMPMSVFGGKAQHYGVIYPMQTFTKARKVDFSVIPCFVEGSDPATLSMLQTVCASISRSVICLSSEKRRTLHLAAVFACNFANHCYDVASRLLAEQGLDFGCMLPLIGETAAKVGDMSPAEAQTGPAVRFDRNVMERHLAMLDGKPQWQRLYEIMSEDIHQTMKSNDKL